jgi:translation initiation factor 3 subunit E
MVIVLFEFGQQQFSCGNYAAASDLLYQFRILVGFSVAIGAY